MILSVHHPRANRVTVVSEDTDFLVLLLAHNFPDRHLYMQLFFMLKFWTQKSPPFAFTLLTNLNVGNHTDNDYYKAEQFMCRLYKDQDSDTFNNRNLKACNRHKVTVKSLLTMKKPEDMPPISNTARLPKSRAFLLTYIWQNASVPLVQESIFLSMATN